MEGSTVYVFDYIIFPFECYIFIIYIYQIQKYESGIEFS